MPTTRIAIVGGGLSGLYAAWLLERHAIRDHVLLEARERLGGRIECACAPDRFDLGPTWFWPGYQPLLDRLVEDLGLERFQQFEAGDMVVERMAQEAPVRTHGYANSPASMRLVGGMIALADSLRRELDPARIITGQSVRRLRVVEPHLELDAEDAAGRVTTWRPEHVLLALPPRLAVRLIDFAPALPPALARQWRSTATWMAPHAKYIAAYDTPFWREQGLSGEARSARGPLSEIHDASMPGGSAALSGFFGVPARVRRDLSEAVLRTHCRAQLARLFGPQAAAPHTEYIKDWAQDAHTATPEDLDATSQHAAAPAATVASGPWQGRLTGIASEWSPQFPGYVAGAIEAANLGVRRLPIFENKAGKS